MAAIFEPLVDAVYAQDGFVANFAGDAVTAIFSTEDGSAYERALAAAIAVQRHMVEHPLQNTPFGEFPFSIKLGLGDGNVTWGILAPASGAGQATYYFGGPAVEAAAESEHLAQPGNIILSATVNESLGGKIKTISSGYSGHARLLAVDHCLPPAQPLGAPEMLPGQADFVSPSILDRSDQGEFRQVICVFVNLMGISGGADLKTFVDAVFELQEQYGGYLNGIDFGDKGCNLLFFWGMPKSREDDIVRALDFIHTLGDHTSVPYKAGITYQPMYAGLSGSIRQADYTAFGRGVSYAARLMMAAPWSRIWLDERMAKRAGTHYVIEHEGRRTFKGFDEARPVYSLRERQALDLADFYRGTMVAREAELAHLEAFVQPLFASQQKSRFAGLLVVDGDAGLGKSRLVTEFLQSLTEREEGVQWFTCQTDQTTRHPLNPFRYWLRNYFEQVHTHSESQNKRAFSRRLDQLVAELPDDAPQAETLQQALYRGRSFLGALIELSWPNSDYAQLGPQGRHELTLSALKSLILAESLRKPAIINLESAQWLDEESKAFIERLVRNIDDYPLAIIATARTLDGKEPLVGDVIYQRLSLTPLSPEKMALLAEDLLGNPIDDDITALLTARAEGNPFFAEQILRYLEAQDGIDQSEGVWSLTKAQDASSLPGDVQAIFAARLDQLSYELKDVVQTAAILGREFDTQVLDRMLHDNGILSRNMDGAEKEMIWSRLTSGRYMFRQGLLRDAAYEMQLRSRRRGLHKIAAETLKEVHVGEPSADVRQDSIFDKIASHYEAAYLQGLEGVRSEAQTALEQAGAQASANYENGAAVDYFSRALALTPDDDADKRYALLLMREAVFHLRGERAAQAADLKVLEALAQTQKRPGEQAEIALRRARFALAVSDFSLAREQSEIAIAYAQAAGDIGQEAAGQLAWGEALWQQSAYEESSERLSQTQELARAANRSDLEARSLRILGDIAYLNGDYAKGQNHYDQALVLAHDVGDLEGECRALNSLGTVADLRGNYEGALGYYEQSLAIAREIGDRQNESRVLENLGNAVDTRMDFAGALAYFDQSLAIVREIGDREGEGNLLGNYGESARSMGDYDKAQSYFEQSLIIRREIGDLSGTAIMLYNQGITAGSQGNAVLAQNYYEQSLAIVNDIGGPEDEGYVLTGLGDVLHELGNSAKSIRLLKQAISIRRELGDRPLVMESLATLARVTLAQRGQATGLEDALIYTEEILAYLDDGGDFKGTEQPFRNYLTCYQVLQANGDHRAPEVLEKTYAVLQEQAARIPDESSRRTFTDNVPWHRAILAAYRGEEPEAAPISSLVDEINEMPPENIFELKGSRVENKPSVVDRAVHPVPETESIEAAEAQEATIEPVKLVAAASFKEVIAAIAAGSDLSGVTIVIQGDIHIHISADPSSGIGKVTKSKKKSKKKKKKRSKKKHGASG